MWGESPSAPSFPCHPTLPSEYWYHSPPNDEVHLLQRWFHGACVCVRAENRDPRATRGATAAGHDVLDGVAYLLQLCLSSHHRHINHQPSIPWVAPNGCCRSWFDGQGPCTSPRLRLRGWNTKKGGRSGLTRNVKHTSLRPPMGRGEMLSMEELGPWGGSGSSISGDQKRP
jgi:hypothetical protein